MITEPSVDALGPTIRPVQATALGQHHGSRAANTTATSFFVLNLIVIIFFENYDLRGYSISHKDKKGFEIAKGAYSISIK